MNNRDPFEIRPCLDRHPRENINQLGEDAGLTGSDNQTKIHTGLTSAEHKEITDIRHKLTSPYGHKLRSIEGILALYLVDSSFRKLKRGRINRSNFESIALLASKIAGVPVDDLIAVARLIKFDGM